MDFSNYLKLNKRYTPAQLRVKVAKDVQKQILAQKYNARSGFAYLGTFKSFHEKCDVCAMGACFLSAFKLFDGDVAQNIRNCNSYGDSNNIGDDDIILSLKSIFTERQLKLIEAAFECNSYIAFYNNNGGVRYERGIGGNKWECIEDDVDRLYAIMQNIIDNKGKFRIEQIYYIVTKEN